MHTQSCPKTFVAVRQKSGVRSRFMLSSIEGCMEDSFLSRFSYEEEFYFQRTRTMGLRNFSFAASSKRPHLQDTSYLADDGAVSVSSLASESVYTSTVETVFNEEQGHKSCTSLVCSDGKVCEANKKDESFADEYSIEHILGTHPPLSPPLSIDSNDGAVIKEGKEDHSPEAECENDTDTNSSRRKARLSVWYCLLCMIVLVIIVLISILASMSKGRGGETEAQGVSSLTLLEDPYCRPVHSEPGGDPHVRMDTRHHMTLPN